MDADPYYIKLIIGYLDENLDNEELDEFFQWIGKDPRNEQFYFDIKSVFDSLLEIDVKESWLRMEQKIKTGRQHKNLIHTLFPYAASLLVIISTATYLIINTIKSIPVTTYQYFEGKPNEAGGIILPDNTKINLAPESKIIHNSSYGTRNRVVELEGEAFFDVISNPSSPFIVKLGQEKIEVLGTKFNVKSLGKFGVSSYSSDSIALITLVEGSLRFSTSNQVNGYLLKPGEQLCFNKKTGKVNIEEVNTKFSIGWVSGYYRFEDVTLGDILLKMSRMYDVNFVFEQPQLKSRIYSGTFYKTQSLNDILKIITLASGVKYEINGKTVKIKSK